MSRAHPLSEERRARIQKRLEAREAAQSLTLRANIYAAAGGVLASAALLNLTAGVIRRSAFAPNLLDMLLTGACVAGTTLLVVRQHALRREAAKWSRLPTSSPS